MTLIITKKHIFLHLFISVSWSCLLPGISFLNAACSTCFDILSPLPSTSVTVTETLLTWIWIFWMAPWGQKSPTAVPSSSATLISKLLLHGCQGRDCLRCTLGKVSSTVPRSGGVRVQVTLLRGAGRQVDSWGTDRRMEDWGQSLSWLHPDIKAQKY